MRTKNQEWMNAIEEFINDYADEYGRAPTIKEIADGVNMSRANVGRYMMEMREKGIIDYSGHSGATVLKYDQRKLSVPVLGDVSCGLPKYAEENIEDYVKLPVSLFGTGDFYFLRAKGESMIEAGICEGDLILVKRQNYASNGQIVVALIDDEATLKRFYPEPQHHRIRLHPENETMKDIYVADCEIQGVAVKVIKDL